MNRTAALLIVSAFFCTACAGSQWVRKPVVKDRDYVISLEQFEKKGIIETDRYAHPHAVSPGDLAFLMRNLTYVEKMGILGKETRLAVFQAVEIERLAPALADALSSADSSQRVRFTSYNRGQALIFSTSRETEGVVFVSPDQRLNIAFAKINAEIDPNTANTFPEDFSRTDPLRISAADTVLHPIPPLGQLALLDNGKTAPMWMTVDLDALKQAAANAPVLVPVTPQTPAASAVPPAQAAPAPKPAVSPAPAAVSPLTEEAMREKIKTKLKYYKELLDEGLISPEDYDAKKTELLEKIQ